MDPLDFTSEPLRFISLAQTQLTPESRIRVSALISPETITALKAIRFSRRVSLENTETLIGDLIKEMAEQLTSRQTAAKASGPETLATRLTRWTLAAALIEGLPPLTRAQICERAKVSTATTSLTVKALEALGYVKPELGRSPGGRPVEVYRLTLAGIAASEKDHPEEAARFVLGGMLDPVAASVNAGAKFLSVGTGIPSGGPGEAQDQFWKEALAKEGKPSESEDD